MKILLVNHEYPPVGGGAATATQAIAHNLSALGHDVAVLTAGYAGLRHFTMEEAVPVYRVSCFRKRMDRSTIFELLTFIIAALCRLPFVLIKQRPKTLIVFFSLPSGPLGLAAKMFAGLPYVVSLRGGDVPGLVPELDRIHKLLAPIRRLILQRADAVVANSNGLRELSEQTDKFPVRVIPNGVDTDFFRPASKPSSSRFRVLFVGRFCEQKNLPFLLEQLAKLPGHAFQLHLVGDGPQREALHSLAQNLGIETEIVWHGWIARPALLAAYQSADCLVNPSLYEGMPNVVLEAMACGLPVIASRISGHEMLVSHGETGFLFNLNDSAGLLQALTQLQDVDLRRRVAELGRARVTSEFSWRTTAQSYVESLRV